MPVVDGYGFLRFGTKLVKKEGSNLVSREINFNLLSDYKMNYACY